MINNIKKILLLLLLVSSPLKADEILNLNIAATSLLVADWIQTRKIIKNKNAYETNYILGESPSRRAVNIYFSLTTITIIKTSYLLPDKYKKIFLISIISTQASYIKNNLTLGFSLKL